MTGLRSDLAQTQQQVTNLEAKVDLVTQERDKEQQNVANVTADLTKERKEAQNLQEQLSALGNTHQELANDKAAVEQQFQAFRNQDDAGRAAQYERDVADWKRLYQELVIQKREEAENLQEKVDMAEGEAEVSQ